MFFFSDYFNDNAKMKVNVTFSIDFEILGEFIDMVKKINSTPDSEIEKMIYYYVQIHNSLEEIKKHKIRIKGYIQKIYWGNKKIC